MELETLQIFVDIMRGDSFAGVARSRGVAPSSISRAIASLEQDLGVRLFQRSTRKLEPTDAASLYFQRIQHLLPEFESARLCLEDIQSQPSGTLRVTAATVFGQLKISPLLPEFTQAYPQLSIELLLTDAYVDLVAEHVDLGIRLGSLKDSSYIAKRLRRLHFHICASPAYCERNGIPKNPEDVQNHDALIFPRPDFKLDWLFKDRQGKINRIPINGKVLVTNSLVIRDCAIAGMGLVLLPDWLVGDAIANGQLLDLFPDYQVTATDFIGAAWWIYPSRKYVPIKTRVFMEFFTRKLS